MKKIVVLDGYAMNPGDLSFDGIEALGDCTVYDFTKPGEVLERAKDAEILLSNKTRLTAETIAALPKLEYIGILATGYRHRAVPQCFGFCLLAAAASLFRPLLANLPRSFILRFSRRFCAREQR